VPPRPRGQVHPVAAVEDLNRPAGGHIDQLRSVTVAPVEGEVVRPQHRQRHRHWLTQRLDQPQQRIPPHRHPAASRTLARPASASPIRVSSSRSSSVNRLCGLVKPSTCSAKVTAGQAALPQQKRRTFNEITTCTPPAAASRNWRT